MHHIESLIGERQIERIRLQIPHAGIKLLQERRILEARGYNVILIGIQRLEIVRRRIGLIRGYTQVEDKIRRPRLHLAHKDAENVAPDLRGDADRQRIRFGKIELGVGSALHRPNLSTHQRWVGISMMPTRKAVKTSWIATPMTVSESIRIRSRAAYCNGPKPADAQTAMHQPRPATPRRKSPAATISRRSRLSFSSADA